jgi:K+/H+ antiporter YhaU regulatory subunit KhtT
VIAVRKPNGRFEITPDPDERIEIGDVVIAIGTEPELRALEDMFAPRAVGV